MSALGDYIHFRNKNYIEYGTAKISAANPKKYKSINSQVFLKNRIKKKNAKKYTRKIETRSNTTW